VATVRQESLRAPLNIDSVLGALPYPILVIGDDDVVRYVNGAAESFFEQGKAHLLETSLDQIVPPNSPVRSVLRQVRADGVSISEYDVELTLPRGGGRGLSVHAAPLIDDFSSVVLSIHAHGAARNMERQLVHRSAARSVSAMASMLAHEIKNPLSGIRGAAQLLERVVGDDDQQLTSLICGETDRICALVDSMGVFAEDGPLERDPVNIHEVLERVQQSAAAGFAHHVNFKTEYDPSLPPVLGNQDQLIQVFLNLVKNAAEAVPRQEGEISLKTGFRRGVKLTVPGIEGRVHLPLMVTVSDNGPGMTADIARHLFDPFITTKAGGTGLGLALVAKVVNDHGGTIEFDTDRKGTSFRIFLPLYEQPKVTEKPA
jgi:two-component system, NtrC family, nitrogen regulation sensor histidine kinase GlnL